MVVFIALNILYLWDQNKKKAAFRMVSTPEQERPGLGDKSAWFIYSLWKKRSEYMGFSIILHFAFGR